VEFKEDSMEAKVVVFLLLTSSVVRFNNFFGKHYNILFKTFLQFAYFDIELQQIVQTFGEDFIDGKNIKIKKIPGTRDRGLFGSATLHGDIDNSFKAFTTMYVKQGGEYRLTPFKVPSQSFYDFVNNDKTYIPELAKVSNFTQPMPCPLSKVNHVCIFVFILLLFFSGYLHSQRLQTQHSRSFAVGCSIRRIRWRNEYR
jgi:hypothetical protein